MRAMTVGVLLRANGGCFAWIVDRPLNRLLVAVKAAVEARWRLPAASHVPESKQARGTTRIAKIFVRKIDAGIEHADQHAQSGCAGPGAAHNLAHIVQADRA